MSISNNSISIVAASRIGIGYMGRFLLLIMF